MDCPPCQHDLGTQTPGLRVIATMVLLIDRVERSNVEEAKAIEEVLELLKPARDKGLRVRVGRSPRTLVEDKAWRRKAS
jgi:hypothetical protein